MDANKSNAQALTCHSG